MTAVPPPPQPPTPASAPGAPERKSNTLLYIIIGAVVLPFLCLFCGGIGSALLMPAILKARSAAHEAQARSGLQQVRLAQASYEIDHGAFAPSIDELTRGRYLDATALDPERSQYTIRIESGDKTGFTAVAVPAAGDFSRLRKSFFIDQTGTIRSRPSSEGPARASDPEDRTGR